MGMAASQARYLALTARKTNTEYEGQQINQARTALANQSANLFNRLLDLEVPVAPKTTDFTELQYSYSDGQNESVLESWQQLSSADPNYNYIVNHYYYTNVYTGSQKLLENPQVTLKGEVKESLFSDKPDVQSVAMTVNQNGQAIIEILGTNGVITQALPVSLLTMTPELENALTDFEESNFATNPINRDEIYTYKDNENKVHFILESDLNKDYATMYKPTYIGNCELTELTNLNEDQVAELAQIIKDCPDSNMNKYLSLDADRNLVYNGEGVYAFQMNGVNYFTNEADLNISLQSYNEYSRPIDDQRKLAYYNASYIKTKIEETNHALLETDENGRFTSVRFDNDSLIYTLNTETVTDEAAYQDAMNEYNYKVQQYEKIIADINARTSIIQEEDRTLELRLKQLDTEQKALATEMDAVKKVIQDNVEKTFKTFSD